MPETNGKTEQKEKPPRLTKEAKKELDRYLDLLQEVVKAEARLHALQEGRRVATEGDIEKVLIRLRRSMTRKRQLVWIYRIWTIILGGLIGFSVRLYVEGVVAPEVGLVLISASIVTLALFAPMVGREID